MSRISFVTLAFILLISLTGCGPSQQEIWKQQLNSLNFDAKNSVKRLANRIDSGLIGNTSILTAYASTVKKIRPEASELVDALAQDATTNGPIYKGLVLRQQEAQDDIAAAVEAGESQVSRLSQELLSIAKASSPVLFGMMLTDPINVLADMSKQQLARVESLSADATKQITNDQNTGIGNQMVGNPNYGQWRSQSNGSSFWEFYGQYALISSLFGRGPMSYNSWAYNRPYSYYHDYGRSSYTSPRQRLKQNELQKKTASKFRKQGKSFRSPYAQKRPSTRSVDYKTKAASKSFKSKYTSASRTSGSSYSGSVRNGSSYSSRSFRGGK